MTVIDHERLDQLATWLCQEKEYHYPIEKMRTRQVADHEFERQTKENGGYCHLCKDFAGELLCQFDVTPKVSA